MARQFNVFDLEHAIHEEVQRRPMHPALAHDRQVVQYAPPAVRKEPLPEYVEHRDNVGEIGQLSAEALVKEYEAAAKHVEEMGKELKDYLAKLDATKAEAMLAIDEIKETAARYRDEGKRVFLQIEDCSSLTAEVRATCQTLKGKIAISAVTTST